MQLLCGYASNVCDQPRAVRRDGRLHNYCEEHRQKANEAQKRWYERHRQPTTSTPLDRCRRKSEAVHRRFNERNIREYKEEKRLSRGVDTPPRTMNVDRWDTPLCLPDDLSMEAYLLAFDWDAIEAVDLHSPHVVDTMVVHV